MKLSLVFELLLIFVLLAFAASKTVTGIQKNNKKEIQIRNDDTKIEDNTINKYCKCSEAFCNCCRDFAVPVVNLNGPGCASLRYINGDKMSVSLSFGRKVITNRTLSSRKPSPVCMPLPGGISKFCGRVYNIARTGEEFRACLGLELQSKSTVEAAVRVSCFKFGPRGVTSEPADPLPLVPQDEKVDEDEDDDDDDDDDDDFGLGSDDADDDDDDDDDDEDDDDAGLDAVNDVDSADYTGFSLLGDDLLGDLFGSTGGKKTNKNKKKQAPISSTTTSTTRRPRPTRRPSRRTTTPRIRTTTVRVVRPISRRPTTRRPIRRPINPNRRSTTAATPESTTATTTAAPVVTSTVSLETKAPDNYPFGSAERVSMFESVSTVKEQPSPVESTTKSVTFEDAGLELSLAHITDQLAVMPVTPMTPSNKDSGLITNQGEVTYEKIETVTNKISTTVPIHTASETVVNDDMVQIVQSLDSHSEEHAADEETEVTDESRGYGIKKYVVPNNYYGGLQLPKKKHRGEDFNLHDLDVLDLTKIGESVGHELGIFGRNKRQNKSNKHDRPHINENNDDQDEYDDVLGLEALSDSIGISRRKHKMMRGIWSNV